jgi:hypothetical protein
VLRSVESQFEEHYHVLRRLAISDLIRMQSRNKAQCLIRDSRRTGGKLSGRVSSCIHIYTHYTHISTRIHLYTTYPHVYTCIHTYPHVSTRIHMYTHVSTCIHTCTRVSILSTCVHTYPHVSTPIHMCPHVSTCIHTGQITDTQFCVTECFA